VDGWYATRPLMSESEIPPAWSDRDAALLAIRRPIDERAAARDRGAPIRRPVSSAGGRYFAIA